MSELLVRPISKGIVLNRQLGDGLPHVLAEASQLRQVMLNLVTNAAEAIGSGSGIIAIATGATECAEEDLKSFLLGGAAEAGTYVYLEIRDTGSGIAEDDLPKIFDPFFTTRFAGRGLGLAAVLGIVRGHKGVISIDSHPGKGTTVKVMLPADERAGEIDAPVPPVEVAGSGAVLLADDEETVRVVASRMLTKLGFDAICAEDGREAVRVFEERADDIACVILDLTMPHMDGPSAMEAIRQLRPDVPVLLCSGYEEQELQERFAEQAVSGFLHKPYGTADLASKLGEALGGPVD